MLYSNEKISDDFIDISFTSYAGEAYEIAIEAAQKMRDDYEAALAKQAAEIGRLTAENVTADAEIAELLAENDDLEAELVGYRESTAAHGIVMARRNAEIERLRQQIYGLHRIDCTCGICAEFRPDPESAICCICGRVIDGDDYDSRFWLHKIGCKRDGCDCDYDCHEDCYPGHEHEYAPLDDDDDEVTV